MKRCHYYTGGGWGSAGKNVGGAASHLERPEVLLGWGRRKRPRRAEFSRKKAAVVAVVTAGTPSSELSDKITVASMGGRAIRSEKERAVLGRRRKSSNHRIFRSLEGYRGIGGQQRLSPPESVSGVGRLGVSPEKCGSSSGSEGAAWPRIEITLTTQEKEEDFMAFKGTKPSLRPKKRAKPIQKSVNLMSPGAWLCDLSLERYEVREKKTSKKRPRGLRAMGIRDSDSE